MVNIMSSIWHSYDDVINNIDQIGVFKWKMIDGIIFDLKNIWDRWYFVNFLRRIDINMRTTNNLLIF
jgi:hypothetical protein